MAIPTPIPGLVVSYTYLWRREHERGQEEGLKDRPCVVVLSSEVRGDVTIVTVVPVTRQPPVKGDEALELPGPTKLRLGLDATPSWIVLTEVNSFVWPGPDLKPKSGTDPARFAYGVIPPRLFGKLRSRLASALRARRISIVRRQP